LLIAARRLEAANAVPYGINPLTTSTKKGAASTAP